MAVRRYREKPSDVSAKQWFPGVQIEGVQEAFHDPGDGSTTSSGWAMAQETPEGPIVIKPGDWIAQESPKSDSATREG